VSEFENPTFLLNPDEAGAKLKRQILNLLLPAMPVRVIEPAKQADQMTGEELTVVFQPKAT
jgi:hypothetical protein